MMADLFWLWVALVCVLTAGCRVGWKMVFTAVAAWVAWKFDRETGD